MHWGWFCSGNGTNRTLQYSNGLTFIRTEQCDSSSFLLLSVVEILDKFIIVSSGLALLKLNSSELKAWLTFLISCGSLRLDALSGFN